MRVIEKALTFLKAREFVAVATADKVGKPNSAPKLLLKIDGGIVYFIDYSMGKTAENLRVNPRVSLSLIDFHSLFGYVLNGRVEIIENGKIYDECLKELREKEAVPILDDLGKARFAIGRKPHHLVFAGVDLETGVVRHR